MKKISFMYRDGSNYKFNFDRTLTAGKIKELEKTYGKLKVGTEITYEDLGITQKEFHDDIVGYEYNDEDDHNIIEIQEIEDTNVNAKPKKATGIRIDPKEDILRIVDIYHEQINVKTMLALSQYGVEWLDKGTLSEDIINVGTVLELVREKNKNKRKKPFLPIVVKELKDLQKVLDRYNCSYIRLIKSK